jgi:hypothetical protein
MKTLCGRQYSFKHRTQYSLEKKVLDPSAANIHSSLTSDAVLVPFIWKRWLAIKVMVFTHEINECKKHSFKQLTQFTVLNKVLDPVSSNINDSLTRATVFVPFTWMGWFFKMVMFLTHETLRGRQYSFKELIEFTMLNKLLYSLASTINDSPTRSSVLLPFTCMGQFWTKWCYCPWKHWEVDSIPKQLTQFTVLNKILDPLASNICDSLTRASVLHHSLERVCFAQSWCSSPMKMLRGRHMPLTIYLNSQC